MSSQPNLMDHSCALRSFSSAITTYLVICVVWVGDFFSIFFYFFSYFFLLSFFFLLWDGIQGILSTNYLNKQKSHLLNLMPYLYLHSSSFSWGYLIKSSIEWRLLSTNHTTHFYSETAVLADLTSHRLTIQHLHQNTVWFSCFVSVQPYPEDVGVFEVLCNSIVLQPWDFLIFFEALMLNFLTRILFFQYPAPASCSVCFSNAVSKATDQDFLSSIAQLYIFS